MLYGVLYLVVCIFFARFVSEMSALWMLAFGVGFSSAWIVRDLMEPYKQKEEDEYQRIEFGDE